jgi:hypothetical protein
MSRRTALILLAVIACAVGVNTLVAMAARQAGASTAFSPLQLPVYGAFTAAGVIAGWIGWQIVRRRSPQPTRTLKALIPAATLLSFVPDVALLTLKFIPNASSTAVAALMLMHVIVVALAIPGYLLAAPITTQNPSTTPSRHPVGTA